MLRARPGQMFRVLLAVAFFLWRVISTSAASSSETSLLKGCFGGSACLRAGTTWAHFTQDRPSCLAVEEIWWSEHPAVIPVTLVTQLSAERLEQVRAQCSTWAGPLAAALYVPLHSAGPAATALSDPARHRLAALARGADELFRSAEAALRSGKRSCQLRLMLVYELFADVKATVLYPVNSLRNLARLMADTDLITNIDVDMVPSVTISEALSDKDPPALYTSGCRQGKVYVWPALETGCKTGVQYADAVTTFPKAKVVALMREKHRCVAQMRWDKAPLSHNATDFGRWMGSSEPYSITYGDTFEPWFLSWRRSTAWFDYRCEPLARGGRSSLPQSTKPGSRLFVPVLG